MTGFDTPALHFLATCPRTCYLFSFNSSVVLHITRIATHSTVPGFNQISAHYQELGMYKKFKKCVRYFMDCFRQVNTIINNSNTGTNKLKIRF